MNIFTSIFERIDGVVVGQIANNTTGLMNVMSPVFASAFAVYVMFVFWGYWQGSSPEQTMMDLLKRIFAWGMVLSMGINVGGYNDYILPIVLNLGDGLSQIYGGNHTSNASALDSVAKQIIDLVNTNMDEALKTKGIPEKIGAVISTVVDNSIILICSSIFLVIAAAYITLAKVFLALLAIVGPIFIALFLFPATRQFGMAWINQVVNYGMLMFFINVSAGFFIHFIDSVLKDMVGSGNAVLDGVIGVTGVMQIALATLMFFVVILKLPELTSGLAGGVAGNGFGNMVSAISTSGRAVTQMKSLGRKGKEGGSITPEKDGK